MYHTGNNYSPIIKLLTKPLYELPEGIAVSGNGKEIANGTNGYIGIAPYNIYIDVDTVVYRGYETGKVLCAENILKDTFITFNSEGKIIEYTGIGLKIGKTTTDCKKDELGSAYLYPVDGSQNNENLQIYIINTLETELIATLNTNNYRSSKWVINIKENNNTQIKEFLINKSSSNIKQIEYAILGDNINTSINVFLVGDYINIFLTNNTVNTIYVKLKNLYQL